MGKYYQVTIDVNYDKEQMDMQVKELNPYEVQTWIMDLIRLNTRETLEKIFKEWELFSFIEDEDDEDCQEEVVDIQYLWDECGFYYYFVYGKDKEDARKKMMWHLFKEGLPE